VLVEDEPPDVFIKFAWPPWVDDAFLELLELVLLVEFKAIEALLFFEEFVLVLPLIEVLELPVLFD
jgi:hypothetical protein